MAFASCIYDPDTTIWRNRGQDWDGARTRAEYTVSGMYLLLQIRIEPHIRAYTTRFRYTVPISNCHPAGLHRSYGREPVYTDAG